MANRVAKQTHMTCWKLVCTQVMIDWFLIRLRCDTEDFNVSPTGFRKPRKFESAIRVNFACGIVNSGLWNPEYFNLIFIIILSSKLDICIKLKKDAGKGAQASPGGL